MLTVYHSNQLDVLKSLASQIVRRTVLDSVFQPEVMLVQSNGMAKWLQIQLADDFDIAANITFTRPSHFMWQLYRSLFPLSLKKSMLEKDAMVWILMSILPEIITSPEFVVLRNYISLGKETTQRYYQLAVRLADLYDSYLIYRPDWIKKWQQGEFVDKTDRDEHWQANLWCRLNQYLERCCQSVVDKAAVYQQLIALFQQSSNKDLRARLPNRLFIFGIASLPPLILASLSALAQHIDVHFMLTNPCRWYWGEIPDKDWYHRLLKKQWQHYLNKSARARLKLIHQEQFNTLLASWGKFGRDNLFLLENDSSKCDIDAFVDIGDDSLLHSLQQQILDMDDKSVISCDALSFTNSRKKMAIANTDFSVSFHSCHSKLREVEHLYDYLLDMLDRDAQLSPRNIVVMVADIDSYAPYINAVFGSSPPSRALPFSISDRRISNVNSIIMAFLSLLNLTKSRFTTEDLFSLLDVPAIANKFAVNELEIRSLRQWSIATGIRWGLNSDMLTSLELPATGKHTWDFGLTRMLLGCVMNSEVGSWQSIVPFDASSGLASELVGKLSTFLSYLTKWYHYFVSDRALSEWRSVGAAVLNDFFYKDSDSESTIMLLESEWETVIDQGIQAGYDGGIKLVVIKNMIQSRLDHIQFEHHFLSGKINFCTFMPMRSIPFDVVCLLGMNDGVYPRIAKPTSFDLMNKRPRHGDRNCYDDDRYLFLEAVLSAQKKLYISYVGKSNQDSSICYPSALVDELRNYMGQSFVLESDRELDVDNSAYRLMEHLTIYHVNSPFNVNNYVVDPSKYLIGSYADEWLVQNRSQAVNRLFLTPLSPLKVDSITIEELKKFYRHPVKRLMQKRLGIDFSLSDELLPTAETFRVSAIDRYLINQQLLSHLINKRGDIDKLLKQIQLKGNFPDGAFGQLALMLDYDQVVLLARRVLVEKQPSQCHEVNIDFSDVKLEGWLTDVQSDGLLRAKPTMLNVSDGLDLWIEHLILTLINDDSIINSRLYGLDDKMWRFNPVPKKWAYQQLALLVNSCISGMSTPLLLPIKSAWCWLEYCFDDQSKQLNLNSKNRKRAQDAMMRTWYGHYHFSGECDDYYSRLIPVLDNHHIDKIEQLAIQLLLPMRSVLVN